jgi:glutamine cyclotransferase
MLTWQSHRRFVYDRGTLQLIRNFDYVGEGWGLTNDCSQIFMSDGTPVLRVWNPATLQEIRRFVVHDGQSSIASLNELIRSRRDLRQCLAD